MDSFSTLLRKNPFFILDLSPGVSAIEIERQGRKILGMLELNIKNASCYSTPWGRRNRSVSDVRLAIAELRDPIRYQFHQFWFLNNNQHSESTSHKSKITINYIKAAGF